MTLILVTFFVLNFRLDILDAVGWLDFQGNGLASQGFNENLHSTTETQNEMKSGLFLDVVIRKSATIFKLLAGENQPLLVRGNAYRERGRRNDSLDCAITTIESKNALFHDWFYPPSLS